MSKPTDDTVNATIARAVGWTPGAGAIRFDVSYSTIEGKIEHVSPSANVIKVEAQPPDYLHDPAACMDALAWCLQRHKLSFADYGAEDGVLQYRATLVPLFADGAFNGQGATLTEAIARALYAAITGGENATDQ